MALVPTIKPDDWTGLNRTVRKLASLKLGLTANPTFAGLILTGLTASSLIYTNSSKMLGSATISLPLVLTVSTLSIPVATNSVDGYLSSINWTTFNNKADYSFGANNFTGTGSITAGVITGTSLRILEGGATPVKYITFQGGDQTVDLTYTLPTAYPASIAFLKISNAGVMTTDTSVYLTAETDPVVKALTGIIKSSGSAIGTVTVSSPLDYTTGVLSITGLSTLGTANYLSGTNAAGTGWEYKQLAGTSNRVTVTHTANLITLSAPQDIHSGASPTFAGLTLTGFSGLIKATAGVLSAITDNSTNWDTAYSHSQIVTGNPHSLDYTDIGLSANQVIDWTAATSIFSTTLTGHFGGALDTDGSLTVDDVAAIGTTINTSYGLNIVKTFDTFGYGLQMIITGTPTSDAQTYLGLNFAVKVVSSSNNIDTLTGVNGFVGVASGGSYRGTITNASGVSSQITLAGNPTGTDPVITNAYLFKGIGITATLGATIGTAYGLYIPSLTGTTITTAWGIAINTQSYINANLSVGKNTTPSYPLDVVGDISSSTLFRINATPGVSGTIDSTKVATVIGGIITAIV